MNLSEIWREFQSYDGEGLKNFQLSECQVRFYKGAMEIPLIVFCPTQSFDLSDEKISKFSELINSCGFELDCVEENGNYKINRSEDGQYLGRITPEAFKLHAERIKELGWELFSKIVQFHLNSSIS